MSSQGREEIGYLHLLGDRRLALFLASQILTNVGDGLFTVAVAAYAVELGASSSQLGIIGFCAAIPRAIVRPIGGVIADRVDRRRLMLSVDLLRAAVVAAMPLLHAAGLLGVRALALCALAVAALFSLGSPASKAWIPELVGAESLKLANSLVQAVVWPSYFLGAGLIGLLPRSTSTLPLFYGNGVVFLMSSAALLWIGRRMDPAPRKDGDGAPVRVLLDLRLGYQALGRERLLLARVVTYGSYTFFWRALLQIGLPLLVLKEIGAEAGVYGMLMAASGVGELCGNLIMGKLRVRSPIVTAFSGEVLLGLAALGMAASAALRSSVMLIPFVLLIGVSASVIDIPLVTAIQQRIPRTHTAKVFSYWQTVGALGGALGSLCLGAWFELVPIGLGIASSGLLILLMGAAFLGWVRKRPSPGIAGLAGALLAFTPGVPSAAPKPPKIEIGGFVRLDVQYEDRDTLDFLSPVITEVPFEDDPERQRQQLIVDARASRLRFLISEDLGEVKVSGRIEADFYNPEGSALHSNSRNFRLRRALIKAEHLLGLSFGVGQYEDLLTSELARPTSVDLTGPVGQVFARQPQIRFGYAHKLPEQLGELRFDASMEKSSTDDLGADVIREDQGQGQPFPLYAGKISWLGDPFKIEAALAAGVNQVTLAGGRQVATRVWGVQTSAEVAVGPVTAFGHYQHLDGLGRLAYGDFDSIVLAGSEISNIETNGWYAGATWRFIDSTSVTGILGWHRAGEIVEGGFTGDELQQHRSMHANVIHRFWEHWQVGLEYRRFEIEAFSGRAGHVNGLLSAVWFFLD